MSEDFTDEYERGKADLDAAIRELLGERLLEEVNLTLDRVHAGESTVREAGEGYEEFWRARAGEFGLEAADSDDEEG